MAITQYIGPTLSGHGFNDAAIDVTAATLSATVVDHAGAGRVVTLSRAAGITVTLPAAIGSGARFTFIVKTTVTSNSDIIKVANASDTMCGGAFVCNDTDNSVSGFEAAGTADTITLNGTTTGGIRGDVIELLDMAANLWSVRVTSTATGTEATPFSATV